MIIDCHTHIGRNDHIRATAEDLIKSMDASGIDKSLVFAGELNDVTTPQMMVEIEPYRDRLYGVASWDFSFHQLTHCINYGAWALGTPQAVIFRKLYDAGLISAVKFYTGYDHYMPNGPEIRSALDELNRSNNPCPVIFHCGDCLNSVKCAKLKYAHPLHIDDIAVDYPKINFVIAHMAYPFQREAAEVCYKNDNVYSDISGFVYGSFLEPSNSGSQEQFKKVVNEFRDICPSDKLLFGTDFPISNQEGYFHALFNGWGSALSPEGLSENAQKVFKLK